MSLRQNSWPDTTNEMVRQVLDAWLAGNRDNDLPHDDIGKEVARMLELIESNFPGQLALAEDDSQKAPAMNDTFRPTHRQVKTGRLYEFVGVALRESDLAELTIYRGEKLSWWASPTSEFTDGRFEEID